MEKSNFYFREQECYDTFSRFGQVFNACTPENHPIIFRTSDEFKAGVSILGISVLMFPSVKIYAFQLMSNHIHLTIGGSEPVILEFFSFFKSRLEKYFESIEDGTHPRVDLSQFILKLYAIEDLLYFRNALVYTNRNGAVVNEDVTPFSYPWGTSPFFFQPLAVRYARLAGKPIGIANLRSLMHTKMADTFKDTITIDGYVSPLEFCEIFLAEKTFRSAKQYFYMISRNVEAYSNVAKSIGESVYYNDNDLYLAASKIAKENFGTNDMQTLSAKDKIELAKRLHFDYNAGEKQIQRFLKLEPGILKALF